MRLGHLVGIINRSITVAPLKHFDPYAPEWEIGQDSEPTLMQKMNGKTQEELKKKKRMGAPSVLCFRIVPGE